MPEAVSCWPLLKLRLLLGCTLRQTYIGTSCQDSPWYCQRYPRRPFLSKHKHALWLYCYVKVYSVSKEYSTSAQVVNLYITYWLSISIHIYLWGSPFKPNDYFSSFLGLKPYIYLNCPTFALLINFKTYWKMITNALSCLNSVLWIFTIWELVINGMSNLWFSVSKSFLYNHAWEITFSKIRFSSGI